MNNKEELQSIYDKRKSFYGKAKILKIENKNVIDIKLFSYGTEVARFTLIKPNFKKYQYYGNYSQTTTRHQKEFFKQMGLCDKEIKELFKNGKLEKEL